MDKGSQSLRKKKNTVFEKTFRNNSKHWHEEQNVWVCDDMIFKNKNLNPKFPKLKFLAFSINFQASNQFCTKFKVFAKLGWSDHKHTQ